ncbi:MAG TPA: hypothetical protein VGX37_07765 [Allosphingosinicella sp.]|nr:hypothetical protein [Allosphingosinicella sp.]
MSFAVLRNLGLLAVAALALAAQPALAQQGPPQPRTLDVPAASAWQHAATQITLPPQAAGLRRLAVRDSGDAELDVIADYSDEAQGVVATVYLFKTQVPDAALWFDRALETLRLRPGWSLEAPPRPAPTPVTRPGAQAASGLRTAFDVGAPDVRSTALAVAPLSGFLFKVRMSSARLQAAQLDALLTRFIGDLRWPTPVATERPAVAVQPCPEPLRLRQARLVRDDMGDVLMNLLTGIVEVDADAPPAVYCREGASTLQHGVYRPGGSRQAYLIALADSGVALSVGRGIQIDGIGGGGRRFSMRLLDRNTTSALPSFNRLPPPEQAIAVAFGHRGDTISVSTEDGPKR